MTHSRAVQREVTCTACRQPFTFDVWAFIDCRERPDLVGRIRDGTLYALSCPACAAGLGELDGYFALIGLDGALPVLFSPGSTTSPEQNRQLAEQVVMAVHQEHSDGLVPDWMERFRIVRRDVLRLALAEWSPRRADPFAHHRLATLLAFVTVETGPERRRVVVDLPEVLDDESLALSERWVAAARQPGNHPSLERDLAAALDQLRRCAAEGVDRVLPESLDAILEELEQLADREPARSIELLRLALAYGAGEGIGGTLQWEGFHDGLALRLMQRGEPVDFEDMIELLEGRERANPPSLVQRFTLASHWAARQALLGMAYLNRSLAGEREHNLERAIARLEAVFEIWTRDAAPEQWAAAQIELVEAFAFCIAGDRQANFEKAIACGEGALAVFAPTSHPAEWLNAQLRLGRCYLAHRQERDHATRVDGAIAHLEQALAACDRARSPGTWASCHVELAIACRNRTHATDWGETVDAAIAHLQAALEVFTREVAPGHWASTQHQLGDAYAARPRGEREANDAEAIGHFRRALEVRTVDDDPRAHGETQRELGDLYFRRREWGDALAAYRPALQAGEERLADVYSEGGRTRQAARMAEVYARTAYCLLQTGSPGEALGYLEAGRARVLSQGLTIDDLDLSALPEDRRDSLRRARDDVRLLEGELRRPTDRRGKLTDAELADRLRKARRQLFSEIRGAIVAQPELYPTAESTAELLAIAPAGGAVVAYLVTSMGSAALVFAEGTVALSARNVVELDGVDSHSLLQLLSDDTLSHSAWLGAYAGAQESGDIGPFAAAVEKTLAVLWTKVVGPVADKLAELEVPAGAPLAVLPHGLLGMLPLHAAGRDVDGAPRTLGDDYAVAYAPSLTTLDAAQRRATRRAGNAPSLLAVADPQLDLPCAGVEAEAVAACFAADARVVLTGAAATQAAVVERVAGCSYLHFACHGFYDWSDVMNSGLLLAEDDPLTLAELVSDLTLGAARLVTLSACESGLADIQHAPDEYVSLVAGFLRAGAPAVVATLWPVDDLACALLVEDFYRRHLQEGQPIARALAGAQAWLRELRRDEVLARVRAARDRARARGADEERARLGVIIEFLRGAPLEHRPFASPYYWASFVAAGAAC